MIVLSQDKTYFIVIRDTSIKVTKWNGASYSNIQVMTFSFNLTYSALSSDNNYLYLGGDTGHLLVLQNSNPTFILSQDIAVTAMVIKHIAVSVDNQMLAISGTNTSIYVYQMNPSFVYVFEEEIIVEPKASSNCIPPPQAEKSP